MVRKSAKKTGNPKATAHSEPSTPHDDPLSTPHANTLSNQDPDGVTRQLFSLTPQVTAEELLNMREEAKRKHDALVNDLLVKQEKASTDLRNEFQTALVKNASHLEAQTASWNR
uniref:Uncharacterized protein n=1 Tax=Lepeophtheirus salmonis TaxID=72036 RepID=A0A0K2UZR1_LEPSM